MNAAPLPEPHAQPGQQVRWRHPRLAMARGWFSVYGPGPFEVVRLVPEDARFPTAYLVKTPAGLQQLSVWWVGLPV